jgi:hypothetical protein
LYFCPPIVAAYMSPPSAIVKVCMPFT